MRGWGFKSKWRAFVREIKQTFSITGCKEILSSRLSFREAAFVCYSNLLTSSSSFTTYMTRCTIHFNKFSKLPFREVCAIPFLHFVSYLFFIPKSSKDDTILDMNYLVTVELLGDWYVICIVQTHSGSVWKVTWAHPEFGQVLASCSFDRTAAVWEEQGTIYRVHDLYDTWRLIQLCFVGWHKVSPLVG